jgi:hypothetical protein
MGTGFNRLVVIQNRDRSGFDNEAGGIANKLAKHGLKLEYPITSEGDKDVHYIEVPDYKGRGMEIVDGTMIQNLAEAEYAVALYMHVRLHEHLFDEVKGEVTLAPKSSRVLVLTTDEG